MIDTTIGISTTNYEANIRIHVRMTEMHDENNISQGSTGRKHMRFNFGFNPFFNREHGDFLPTIQRKFNACLKPTKLILWKESGDIPYARELYPGIDTKHVFDIDRHPLSHTLDVDAARAMANLYDVLDYNDDFAALIRAFRSAFHNLNAGSVATFKYDAQIYPEAGAIRSCIMAEALNIQRIPPMYRDPWENSNVTYEIFRCIVRIDNGLDSFYDRIFSNGLFKGKFQGLCNVELPRS